MGKVTEAMLVEERLRASKGGRQIDIAILPRAGAHLVSYAVDGEELLHFSRQEFLAEGPTTGCFVMFPTPCRLTGSKYPFAGRQIRQQKGAEDVFIHGLIRDEAFQIERGDDYLEASIDIGAGHPVYEGYPFACRFAVRYQLVETGLRVSFHYENRGDAPAPFGFGVHPYWKLDGERGANAVKVPCDYTMELVDLIPTGQLDPVAGTPLDLRDWTSLAGVDIDNAFFGRQAGATGGLERRDTGLRVSIDASPELTHMIAYAPGGQPFACVENLTCSPDAPNVYAAGHREASGLVVVEPGQSHSGWISWSVEAL